MSKSSKVEISEAVKEGLKNFRESAAEYSDPYLGQDANGGTGKLDTLNPTGPGAGYNMSTLSPAGGGVKKKTETEEEQEEVQEDSSTSDYLSQLFDGEDLSEEFMEKIGTIFETALTDRISFIESSMQESFNQALNEQVETLSEDLSEKLDEFLSYVVDEWTKENELAIERGIQADIAESFMTGLKQLFESHYIEMPEEKVNVVEELLAVKQELEEQLNSEMDKNLTIMGELNSHKAQTIFNSLSEDLTDTQAEKFAQLIENVDFNDDQEYARKLSIIKGSFLSKSYINEEVTESEFSDLNEAAHNTGADPIMEAYSNAISFQNRNKK